MVVKPKGMRSFLTRHKRFIKGLRDAGELSTYRKLHALVRGTPEEDVFWFLIRERLHLIDIQKLLDRQNNALYCAARDRDFELHRVQFLRANLLSYARNYREMEIALEHQVEKTANLLKLAEDLQSEHRSLKIFAFICFAIVLLAPTAVVIAGIVRG